MGYKTVIDSIGVRVECKSASEQRELLDRLLEYTRNSNSSFFISYKDHIINPLTGAYKREYFIYGYSKTLASITTMSYQVGMHRRETVYYIKIVFAGLKQYNEVTDRLSLLCMMSICSWLYNGGHLLQLSEFDIAVDVEDKFDSILVLPVKRVPNVKYYSPNEEQRYSETVYLEKINLKRKERVSSRSYIYNKTEKDGLDTVVTRFELKLQTSFFKRSATAHFEDMVFSIGVALDRYAILYFANPMEKDAVIQQYIDIVDSNVQNKSRKLQGLDLEAYRLYPDMNYVKQFLSLVLFTHDFHTNMNDELFVESVLAELQ